MNYSFKNFNVLFGSIAGFVGILIFVIFKHYIIHYMVLNLYSVQANSLAKLYTENIFNRYYPVLNFAIQRDKNEREIIPQYENYKTESIQFFADVAKAVIIKADNSQIMLFDNTQDIIKHDSLISNLLYTDYNTIVRNASNNIFKAYLTKEEYKNKEKTSNEYFVAVTVPMHATRENEKYKDAATNTLSIAVIYFNVSNIMLMLTVVQYILAACFAVLCVAIIGASVTIRKKSMTLIEKQYATSVEMAQAKEIAENESLNKSRFLANVSHELRTPLNAIIGFSEMMKNEDMGPINNAQYKECVKDIHASGQHLLNLINDILDYSKAEENKLDAHIEDVDIVKLVKVCLRMLMPRAEEAHVTLIQNIALDGIVIKADPKRLKQVLLNIMSNSVKFTPENGKVTTSVNVNGDKVIIEIQDTGVGMEPQDLAKAMSPFGQIQNKLSDRYDGTGLGLPLSKKLIEIMHGTFDIRSEVGLGTTTTITFIGSVNINTENAN